jgi:hypothetical protein
MVVSMNAFPNPHLTDQLGMILRDYFAAKAMQGMLACPVHPQSGAGIYARDAYAIADAMLKAREA